MLYSVSANATHGLPRNREDKRRAVMTILFDSEWSQWSNREIAKQCYVSLGLVNMIRKSLSEQNVQMGGEDDVSEHNVQMSSHDNVSEHNVQISGERKVTRNGKSYTLNTTNIRESNSARKQPGDYPQPSIEFKPLTPEEITIAAISNMAQLSDEQMDAITQAIEQERKKRRVLFAVG